MPIRTLALLSALFLTASSFAAVGDWLSFHDGGGDLNRDGWIDPLDLVPLEIYLRSGPKPAGVPIRELDMNGDCRVDWNDFNKFARKLIANPGPRPAPPLQRHWFVVGDINGDQVVDVADVVMFAEYLTSHRACVEGELDAADANQDGRIDIGDLQELTRAVFG